jgi:hypothetical protein
MKYSVFAPLVLLLATVCTAHEADGTVRVDSVIADSPAAAAGLRPGDQIMRLDGREIATMDDLQNIMAAHKPGDPVPLAVLREGETVDLTLTFGKGPGGGVSIGVRLAISVDPAAEPTAGTVECLAWIDETYRIDSMMRGLGLELSETYETIRACVERDTQRMISANAIKYCDNVFKVHCSGIDMLTEIGEAQVQRCEELINGSLGLKPEQYKGWKTCGQNKVFDRYSIAGESSDEGACMATFLDECGTNIDTAIKTDGGSSEQREFVDCCSADRLDPESHGQRCGMIEDGFLRGPCHDHPVCFNRLTSEWIHCSVLE